MTPLDPAAIMAAHQPLNADDRYCMAVWCRCPWPCEPYRLADALDTERARVASASAVIGVLRDALRRRLRLLAAERAKVEQHERPAGVDVDAILASIPEDDPGEDPWGGANLAYFEADDRG